MAVIYGKKRLAPGVFVPRDDASFPMDDPWRRLVEVEVEDDEKGRYRFDETYPYLDDSLRYKWNRFLGWFVQWIAVAGINRFKYGLRIRGKKKLKPYKKALKGGAVVVCNHITTFDAVCVYQAVRRFRKLWIPMYAKHFNGSKSWFMRYCGGIPLPENPAGMRKFTEAFDEYHRRRQWILVFPEAVRWDFYQPLRPFRKGAFSMAVKYAAPIVPCVISYRPRTGIYKWFGKADEPLLTIHVCEPIVPDPSANRRHEIQRLRAEAHDRMCSAAGILENPWPVASDDTTT